MAVNSSRSMNTDLQSGIQDGTRKSVTPDRGGVVEVKEPNNRAATLQPQYGYPENPQPYN